MLKFLLLPFTATYYLITYIRNYLYDSGKFISFLFDIPIINIGNLTVGGTGKTPHVEYLIRLLKNNYKIATLSRGYGRKTNGFILADKESNAATIGDEPMQFYSKYGSEINVSVGENRIMAIPSIIANTETDVIVLDDAFQHRMVRPHLNILLSDYNRPFYNDLIMPSGRLRERRKGAERANIVIASKCPPNLTKQEMVDIEAQIHPYINELATIFFSAVKYGKPHSVLKSKKVENIPKNVYLLTGIANPNPLLNYVNKNFNLLKHENKRDHYKYYTGSVRDIIASFKTLPENNKCILTTEKDAVKLRATEFEELFNEIEIYYLPIEIYFLEKQNEFDQLVMDEIIDCLIRENQNAKKTS